MKASDQMYADFGRQMLKQIQAGARERELIAMANEFVKRVVEVDSKFKRDDIVYIIDVDYSGAAIVECKVIDISLDNNAADIWYHLNETAGRYLGRFRERNLFKTGEECAEFYRNFCANYINTMAAKKQADADLMSIIQKR